jgi:DNA-binding MarR family transcriptional regulator
MNERRRGIASPGAAPAPASSEEPGYRQALTGAVADSLIAIYAGRLRTKARPASWHETSMAHYVVLAQLVEGDGLPMTSLARMLDVSLPSMTGIADRMAAHGLVERVRDPEDRRIVRCRLTALGRERLSEMQSLKRDRIACVLGHLSVSRLARLQVAISDLTTAFGAAEACGDLDRFDHPTTPKEDIAP